MNHMVINLCVKTPVVVVRVIEIVFIILLVELPLKKNQNVDHKQVSIFLFSKWSGYNLYHMQAIGCVLMEYFLLIYCCKGLLILNACSIISL